MLYCPHRHLILQRRAGRMMSNTYVVFDLEWNQSPSGKENSIEHFPFEIIEIGAVKMDERLQIISEYHQLVTPQVYTQLHYRITQVTHLHMRDLISGGKYFQDAVMEFLDWCGSGAVFCTWGSMDLAELQRNLDFYGMENPFVFPLCYYDVQKLYAMQQGESSEKLSLDRAVEELGLEEELPFHQALDDAYYTAKVMQALDFGVLREYLSVDYYRLPEDSGEEIRLVFPTYLKYVSREFASRDEALADKGVTEMVCRECRRSLRKKFQWFQGNSRQYLCLAQCPEHGYVRGKIRIRKREKDDESVYVVKTMKSVDETGAQEVIGKREEQRQRKKEHNREKRRAAQADRRPKQ